MRWLLLPIASSLIASAVFAQTAQLPADSPRPAGNGARTLAIASWSPQLPDDPLPAAGTKAGPPAIPSTTLASPADLPKPASSGAGSPVTSSTSTQLPSDPLRPTGQK